METLVLLSDISRSVKQLKKESRWKNRKILEEDLLSKIEDITCMIKKRETQIDDKERKYVDTIKVQNQIIERQKDISNCFREKVGLITAVIKGIESICYPKGGGSPIIFGSFPRQLLESAFMATHDYVRGYGNSIGHDIDIILFDNKFFYNHSQDAFQKVAQYLTFVSSIDHENCRFNGYSLISIKDASILHRISSVPNVHSIQGIPHLILHFKKDNMVIKIDLLAYPPDNTPEWPNGEYDVNSLRLSPYGITTFPYGITTFTAHDKVPKFIDILNNIANRRAVCTIDFPKLLAPLSVPCVFGQKSAVIVQLIHFLTNRLKVLETGYTEICSNTKIPDFTIEYNEICSITCEEPPYPVVRMKCGHVYSVSALTGLATIQSSNATESIKCTQCRQTLDIQMIEKKVPEIKYPKFTQATNTNIKEQECEYTPIISDDVKTDIRSSIRRYQSRGNPIQNVYDADPQNDNNWNVFETSVPPNEENQNRPQNYRNMIINGRLPVPNIFPPHPNPQMPLMSTAVQAGIQPSQIHEPTFLDMIIRQSERVIQRPIVTSRISPDIEDVDEPWFSDALVHDPDNDNVSLSESLPPLEASPF